MEVVLDVDHVNNDGAEHRKEVRSNFYAWLKQQGFPEGYQILCRNCNWAKFRLGECPHALVLESR